MVPVINEKRCIKCGKCLQVCLPKAIDIGSLSIDEEKCFNCLHCMAVCPNNAISFDGKQGSDIDFTKIDASSFENLVFKRRSVRKYLDKPVPDEIIDKLTGLLKYTPTGSNTQKVHVTIVASKDRLDELSDSVVKHFDKLTKLLFNIFLYPLWFMILGGRLSKRMYGFKKNIKRYFDGENILTYNAPCLFIFHAPKSSSTPAQDCSIWSTTGCLYAESLGLGTCFNGFMVIGLNSNKKIKKSLGIPKENRVYSTFLLGYPGVKYLRNVIREETKVNIIR
jgi:nitroreductase/NAD-dependent dihydropyrimidine dehydrogenase PreA subunit